MSFLKKIKSTHRLDLISDPDCNQTRSFHKQHNPVNFAINIHTVSTLLAFCCVEELFYKRIMIMVENEGAKNKLEQCVSSVISEYQNNKTNSALPCSLIKNEKSVYESEENNVNKYITRDAIEIIDYFHESSCRGTSPEALILVGDLPFWRKSLLLQALLEMYGIQRDALHFPCYVFHGNESEGCYIDQIIFEGGDIKIRNIVYDDDVKNKSCNRTYDVDFSKTIFPGKK